jgi:hypothetical protein
MTWALAREGPMRWVAQSVAPTPRLGTLPTHVNLLPFGSRFPTQVLASNRLQIPAFSSAVRAHHHD